MAGWIFGGLTQDVIGHDEVALLDQRAMAWAVEHRTTGLTGVMKAISWLGSNYVVVPLLLLIGGYLLLRRRDARPGAKLAVTVAGSIALYDIVKVIVGRPRPPETAWIGQYVGNAFPSGHATLTVAFYGMLAMILSTGRSIRTRILLWLGAALIALMVGASRIYLGAHWLTDVLGGYALGATWLAIVIAFTLVLARPGTDRPTSAPGQRFP
jgi:undecaprenyl-diphosphatase